MPDYFTLLEQEEPISRLPVENLSWSDTGPAGGMLGNIGTLQKY